MRSSSDNNSNVLELAAFEMTKQILAIRDNIKRELTSNTDLEQRVSAELIELSKKCMATAKGSLDSKDKVAIIRNEVMDSREKIESMLAERPIPGRVKKVLSENLSSLQELESTFYNAETKAFTSRDIDVADPEFSEQTDSSTFDNNKTDISYSQSVNPDAGDDNTDEEVDDLEQDAPEFTGRSEPPRPPTHAVSAKTSKEEEKQSAPKHSFSDGDQKRSTSSTNILSRLFRRKDPVISSPNTHPVRELDRPLTFKKNISDAQLRKLIGDRIVLAFSHENLRENKNDTVITINGRKASLCEAEKTSKENLDHLYQELNAGGGQVGKFKIGDANVQPRITAEALHKNYGIAKKYSDTLEFRQTLLIASALFDATQPIAGRLQDIDSKNRRNNERVMNITRELLSAVDFSQFGVKSAGTFIAGPEFMASLADSYNALVTAAPASQAKSGLFKKANSDNKVAALIEEREKIAKNIKTYTHNLSGKPKENLSAEDTKEVAKLQEKLDKVDAKIAKLEKDKPQSTNSSMTPKF